MGKGKITKEINMNNNDGLSSFDGLAAQQNHNVYDVFYNFLNKEKPKRILEIGTALGGFTQFLKNVSDELKLNIDILSYDIHRMNWYEDMVKNGIDVRVEDVFINNYSEVKQEVVDFIQQDGLTVILCDGGDKVREFNILSDYMKVGDFIMAHDYAENSEVFNEKIKGKIWNWLEIQDGDIKDACEKNNLESYDKDIFDNVVWVCKVKK
jgi:hypothetical protein